MGIFVQRETFRNNLPQNCETNCQAYLVNPSKNCFERITMANKNKSWMGRGGRERKGVGSYAYAKRTRRFFIGQFSCHGYSCPWLSCLSITPLSLLVDCSGGRTGNELSQRDPGDLFMRSHRERERKKKKEKTRGRSFPVRSPLLQIIYRGLFIALYTSSTLSLFFHL